MGSTRAQPAPTRPRLGFLSGFLDRSTTARSPIHFVDAIRTPLLVVQGANDARVHKDQSDKIVERLRQRGVRVHYVVIPGEGHGFSRTENLVAALRATDLFLDRYILGDKSGKVIEP